MSPVVDRVGEAAVQLADAMVAVADHLAYCGLGFADPAKAPGAEQQIAESSRSLVDDMAGEDMGVALGACRAVMQLAWPQAEPEDIGQADWWRTPLGRLCARALGRSDAGSVSYGVAAAMLGVSRGTVGTMVARGTLGRHDDGGVARAAVLRRLGR